MARTSPANRPSKPAEPVGNVGAVAGSLAELPEWHPADGALRALALTLAAQLDAGAGMATAAVSKELRAVLDSLIPNEAPDDDFTASLSTPVLHTA